VVRSAALSTIVAFLTFHCISQPPPLFGLVIGINKYKTLRVSTLKGAVPDAIQVKEYLEKDLGVPPSQIRYLHDEDATRAAIIKEFRDLQDNPLVRYGDPIFIFYAGHGGETDAPQGWEAGDSKIQMLIPYDFRTEIDGREVLGIPDRTINTLLAGLAQKKGDNIVRLCVNTQIPNSSLYASDSYI